MKSRADLSLVDSVRAASYSASRKFGFMLPESQYRKDQDHAGNLIRAKLMKAEMLTLSEGFIEACVAYSKSDLGVMRDLMYRARAPFDVTWIEWDEGVRHESIHHYEKGDLEQLATHGDKAGALIERIGEGDAPEYRVTMFSRTGDGNAIYPIGIRFHTEDETYGDGFGVEDAALYESTGRDRASLTAYLIGGAKDTPWWGQQTYAFEDAWSFANHARFDMTGYTGRILLKDWMEAKSARQMARLTRCQDTISTALREITGDFRWIACVLEMYNMGTKVIRVEAGDQRGSHLVGGQIKPYFRQSRIIVEVPRDRIVRVMQRRAAAEIRRARHHVEGHWCESQKIGDRNCNHVWDRDKKTPRHCVVCSAKQWWKPDFYRGDASIGIVVREGYEVRHRKVKHDSPPPDL